MFKQVLSQMKIAVILLCALTFLTGVIYPGVVTIIAQLLFPWQANGSLIDRQGQIIGSLLIGQEVTDPKYFWGRPSATTPFPYNAENSSGSNLGQSNPAFIAAIKARLEFAHKANPNIDIPIPVELVTASASGLDPHISVRAAQYQALRISTLRKIPTEKIIELIKNLSINDGWIIFGEETVNVLELNLALDHLG